MSKNAGKRGDLSSVFIICITVLGMLHYPMNGIRALTNLHRCSGGIDRIACAVGDLAVDLNAVPCGVGSDCLGASDTSLPLAE